MRRFFVDLAYSMSALAIGMLFIFSFDILNPELIPRSQGPSWADATKLAVLFTMLSVPIELALRRIFGGVKK